MQSELEPCYLLMKRGLYYAPDRQGYTGVKAKAGRYRAIDGLGLDGVTAIHEDDAAEFSPACWPDTKEAVLRAEITRLTEALRAAEEREKALREALIKAEEPHWFYAEGHEERCLYSPDDAIDLLDFNAGEYVTEVATARPCRSIWCAVSVTDDENADERFTFTEHDSEEAARQALAGAKP